MKMLLHFAGPDRPGFGSLVAVGDSWKIRFGFFGYGLDTIMIWMSEEYESGFVSK